MGYEKLLIILRSLALLLASKMPFAPTATTDGVHMGTLPWTTVPMSAIRKEGDMGPVMSRLAPSLFLTVNGGIECGALPPPRAYC